MGKDEKLLFQVLCGTRDANIAFSDLQKVFENAGFSCRIKGDHFIYTKTGIDEIINIQPNGNRAKPYQVKQVRNIIIKYRLGGSLDV